MKTLYVLDTFDVDDGERCIIISDRQDFDFEFSGVYYIQKIPDHYTQHDIIICTKDILYDGAKENIIDSMGVYNIQVFSHTYQRYVEIGDLNNLIVPATINK